MTETATVKDQLLARIADRSAVIGVIGLGYVGLPLAMEFVQAGFTVIGYDVSQRAHSGYSRRDGARCGRQRPLRRDGRGRPAA